MSRCARTPGAGSPTIRKVTESRLFAKPAGLCENAPGPHAQLITLHARMAKLVDAADLKSAGHCGRAGSIPAPGTIWRQRERRGMPARTGTVGGDRTAINSPAASPDRHPSRYPGQKRRQKPSEWRPAPTISGAISGSSCKSSA